MVHETSTEALELCHAAFERRCSDYAGDSASPAPAVTYFHSSRMPNVSLFHIGRLVEKAASDFGVNNSVIASAVVLANRFADATPVSQSMMHRLYIACIYVTLKVTCDYVPSAHDVARLTGVSAWELPRLERALLHTLQYRALVFDADVTAMVDKSTATMLI